MLDIIELLKQKSNDNNPYNDEEKYIEEAIMKDEKDIFLILSEGYIQNSEIIAVQKIKSKYYLVEEFTLGRPFVSSERHYSLIHAQKEKNDKYRVGIFNGATYDTETMVGASHKLICPPEYNYSFHRYIHIIQDWINENIPLTDDKKWIFEFTEVDFTEEIYYPRYYSKRNCLVRDLLNKQSINKLSEVAEIYETYELADQGTAAIVDIDEQKPYRFDNISISYGQKTNVKIQVGDILFPRIAVDAKPFLVTDKTFPNIDAYAGSTVFVIRSQKIIPEYLWLYLVSDVAICINEAVNSYKVINILSARELNDYPVIKQNLSNDKYICLSEILNNPSKRYYEKNLFTTYEQLKTGKIESTNDILSMELWNTVNLFYAEQLEGMLTNDLRELNICYKNQAYKSVLILAGSILEAVLIDWLSEMHGVDYFTRDYRVPTANGGTKRANLVDYINSIKNIKMPAWVSEASKAHIIRQKRNNVHAKLCLDTDDINEDVCNMVIDYLKDVLVSRGVNGGV